MESFVLAGIPGRLAWHNLPHNWEINGAGELVIGAGARTDLFLDPAKGLNAAGGVENAPAALFTSDDQEFLLSATVGVGFSATFDAGVLLVWIATDRWAKLCFERSPAGEPMVVSVVTRGASDDCNSIAVDGAEVRLRIARLGKAFAFHYSLDGRQWALVRYFTLDDAPTVSLGFMSQSPTGNGCISKFRDTRYVVQLLRDLRSGE
ncbi:MAG TPA: DUF1349 domain-containing protein [Spirochaetia bacterium]|nr:DUF1349 domain-containing protein [Spirochaetia bacterium]